MVHKKNVSYVTVNAKAHNILCKDNASERKESLLFISRAQLILCKNKQNISYAEIISHKNNRTTTLCKQLLKNN